MQAFQHGADQDELFFFPCGNFACGNAAAPLKNELEQVVVEPLAYLVLYRFHRLARRAQIGVDLEQGGGRLRALPRCAVHVVDAAGGEIKPHRTQPRRHAHGRVNGLVDGLERGDAHLLQHAAVGQGVHGGRAAIHIVACHIPARAKAGE